MAGWPYFYPPGPWIAGEIDLRYIRQAISMSGSRMPVTTVKRRMPAGKETVGGGAVDAPALWQRIYNTGASVGL